jgi:Ca2+-binding EF-hand superfamily protein
MPKRTVRKGMPLLELQTPMPRPPTKQLNPMNKTVDSPRRRRSRGKRRITAAERVKNGSPRVALSPLRMSVDHSHTIPYHSPRSRQLTPRRPQPRDPMEVLKKIQEHMKQRNGNSSDVVKLFKKIESRTSSNNTGAGFGDTSLGVDEMKLGINFLINTNLTDEDAKQVLELIDEDGDGKVDIREFLSVAQGNAMENKIADYEWKKRRHLIKPEKRRLIEARRPFAKKEIPRTRTDFSKTSHQKFLDRAFQNPTNRNAFYKPEQVLEQLRKRIKTDHIVSAFRQMDRANNINGKANHLKHNSQLEPEELALGINTSLNMDLKPEEVANILQIIDIDKGGTVDVPEFVKALRGPEIQEYIDAKRKALPNHNVVERQLLKAKQMATKIGSRSWNNAHDLYPRKGKSSMIAELAVQDMNPNTNHHDAELGWSGPSILIDRRGHVNWTGKNRRGGPLLGPKIPQHDISRDQNHYSPGRVRASFHAQQRENQHQHHRSEQGDRSNRSNRSGHDRGRSDSEDSSRQNNVDETSSQWMEIKSMNTEEMNDVLNDSVLATSFIMHERNPLTSPRVQKDRPHQGGRAYESTNMYGVFDNDSTIQRRLNDIKKIGNYHARIRQQKDQQRLKQEERDEHIARERRRDRLHPPVLDKRSNEQKMEDDLMAQYTARRYRGPSGY